MNNILHATTTALLFTLIAGCAGTPSDGTGTNEQHVDEGDLAVRPIAGSAAITLGMVQLRDEVIVSEVAQPTAEDIKPGFEVELFAPTTLRPVAGVHGADGLALGARDMAMFNIAPVAAIAQRDGGRQDAALYVESSIAPSGLYMLPTEYSNEPTFTGTPGVAPTAVCDFSGLSAEDATPYPGLASAGRLVDGTVHGGVVSLNEAGALKVRLVAQVEHCSSAIATEAEANAESRLCYEKLVWLKANGKTSTELGRLSAYVAPLTLAQVAHCGD